MKLEEHPGWGGLVILGIFAFLIVPWMLGVGLLLTHVSIVWR